MEEIVVEVDEVARESMLEGSLGADEGAGLDSYWRGDPVLSSERAMASG